MITQEQIKSFLPHRNPFLFIDSLESIELGDVKNPRNLADLVGGRAITCFYTREDLEIFRGHFPGNPILPGVIQAEMMAQTASMLISKLSDNPAELRPEMALTSLNNAKFRRPIRANMSLKVDAYCSKVKRNFMEYHGKVFCEKQLMSEATLMAAVKLHFPTPKAKGQL